MPPSNKWPDFSLASTLWGLVGSSANGSEKGTASQESSVQPLHDEKQPESTQQQRDSSDSNKYSSEHNNSKGAPAQMTDFEERPINDLDSFEGGTEHDMMDNEATGSQADDDDFGPLEMFDSNAAQAPFSSQFDSAAFAAFEDGAKAPEAVMTEEAPSSQARKSKRAKDKKMEESSDDKKNMENGDNVSRKHKKSKRKSALASEEIPDSMAVEEAAQVPYATEDSANPPTHSKRKRNSSDSVESKQKKKKKRSQDVSNDDTDAHAAAFLRTSSKGGALYEDSAADSDPQRSPSVARLRRRSQSHEARSRDNSIGPASNADAMDVDPSAAEDALPSQGSQDLGTGLERDGEPDVENLAREAWNEHVNGQEDVEMANDSVQPRGEDDDDEQAAEPTSATSKRTRSVRAKKAKPTYFEMSPSPENNKHDALDDEMPSPSAMTPKPRNRTKRATKSKKVKGQRTRLAQPTHGGSDDDMDGASSSRPNRASGFTQGRFSDEEIARISRAVEAYRAERDLSQYEVNAMIHTAGGTTAGDEHALLWNRIFDECPDRHRQKVINITRKKFHNFVARAKWNEEQDQELYDLCLIHGNKWSVIANLINRHPEDVRDRYRNYIVCGGNQRKDVWNEEEQSRLTDFVMTAMREIDQLREEHPDRHEMLSKPYEELINWQDISLKMDRTRSRLQCITKWKSMRFKTHGGDKLKSREPGATISFRLEQARRQIAEMPEEERYRFVMAIHSTAALQESKISWQRLVDKQFRDTWHRPTQMLLWRRLKHTVPTWETSSVLDCAQYLIDHYNQTGELPDISDENYSDDQEMAFLETIPTLTGPNGNNPNGNIKSSLSEELIDNVDDETAAAAVPEGTAEDVVDPALSMAQRPSPVAKKETSTPAKKKTGKSSKSANKRSKRGVEPSQDPIEDVEEEEDEEQHPEVEAEAEDHQGADNSDIDEALLRRKKKTPSKFRAAGDHAVHSPHSQVSDSVMDDMEDLPHRVPV